LLQKLPSFRKGVFLLIRFESGTNVPVNWALDFPGENDMITKSKGPPFEAMIHAELVFIDSQPGRKEAL
jgi:hypothetical protein